MQVKFLCHITKKKHFVFHSTCTVHQNPASFEVRHVPYVLSVMGGVGSVCVLREGVKVMVILV